MLALIVLLCVFILGVLWSRADLKRDRSAAPPPVDPWPNEPPSSQCYNL